jgi:hypothetical protein
LGWGMRHFWGWFLVVESPVAGRFLPVGAESKPVSAPRVFATIHSERRRRSPPTNATLDFGLVALVGSRVHTLAGKEVLLLANRHHDVRAGVGELIALG